MDRPQTDYCMPDSRVDMTGSWDLTEPEIDIENSSEGRRRDIEEESITP
jgi:hypothetical protein